MTSARWIARSRTVRAAELVYAILLAGCLYTDNTKCEQPGYPPDDDVVLVDPVNLLCESFIVPGCDLDCGPCRPPDEPLPSWPECDGTCFGYSEEDCLVTPGCRVVRFRSAYYSQLAEPLDSFQGCYSVDTIPGTATECRGLDPQECSRYDACSYLIDSSTECIPEDQIAGRCSEPITCSDPAPSCPEATMPGIRDGCYTGSCIPNEYCGV